MDLMKENIETNAQIIERLRGELSGLKGQCEAADAQKCRLDRDLQEIAARGSKAAITQQEKVMEDLRMKKNEARALKEGVEQLSGVFSPNVSKLDSGDLCIAFTVEGVDFEITIDQNTKAVKDIKKINGEFPFDLSKIVEECSSIPMPQDLRFAVHILRSTIHSRIVLKKHIADLRKFCVVKQDDQTIKLTLRNGILADIAINDSYAQCPASACLVALAWPGCWAQEDLEKVRAAINGKCYSDIRDIFGSLQSLN